MRTANRVKPKTDFGIEVAERSGVKYTTLIETTTGRCAGHQLIPIVREYMANYEQKEA